MPRVDVPAKTNGSAKYGIDVRVPGMAYATLMRAAGARQRTGFVERGRRAKLPGVTDVVMLSDGVAVVGETFAAVSKARRQLNVDLEHRATRRCVSTPIRTSRPTLATAAT